MRTIGIFGKAAHLDIQAVAEKVTGLIMQAGCRVMIESNLTERIPGATILQAEEISSQADLVIVLGGDGTMLRVIRLLDEREVPVLGVNLGFLGYLTEFTVEEAYQHLPRVLAGQFETGARTRLKSDLIRDGQRIFRAKVLNDVVINAGGISRIIDIHTQIDDMVVTTYRADGLIVSTPTGSTAYAMSAGGPIVVPGTRAMVVAPICPHMLTMRPLVVQDDSKICLQVERFIDAVQVTFDGQLAERLQPGDRLEIEQAEGKVLLIRPPSDYFQILRAKLKWGQH